jgi:UPF0755 protein
MLNPFNSIFIKQASKIFRGFLPALRIAAAILIVCTIGTGIWLHSELGTPYYHNPAPETFVDIPRGAGIKETADLLVRFGILRSRLPFLLYFRSANSGRRIQAGEYRFAEVATPKQIAQRLMRGDVFYRLLTVPEGYTAEDIIQLAEKNGLGNRSEMERALEKTEWIRDLDPKARNLEGYLFPETYRFNRKTNAETIIKTMVNQFRTKMAKTLEAYPLRAGWSISQIVVLASMIEKEVKKTEEGPLAASVFINRLDKKMPLACDATVIYGLKLAGAYEGRLRKTDLKTDSPYNSYLHLNLPPGPICNPGVASLRAALNPARTDYLYYVSRNDGTHQFSKNFADHVAAINKYQKSLTWRSYQR